MSRIRMVTENGDGEMTFRRSFVVEARSSGSDRWREVCRTRRLSEARLRADLAKKGGGR